MDALERLQPRGQPQRDWLRMRMKHAQHPAVGIAMQAEVAERIVQAAVQAAPADPPVPRAIGCRTHGTGDSRTGGSVLHDYSSAGVAQGQQEPYYKNSLARKTEHVFGALSLYALGRPG